MKAFLAKLALFLLIGALLFFLSAYAWGLCGYLDKKRVGFILNALPPWQKQELANALNFYYQNNIISKYTTAQLLHCDAESESIKRQFNWFHRSVPGTIMNEMPDYDEIVREALSTRVAEETFPKQASTVRLELLLWKSCEEDKPGDFTRKDAIGVSFGTASLALRIAAASLNPAVGLTITGASIVQASLSDPAKAIPGILCFLDIRFRNFSWCFLISWALSSLIFYQKKQDKKARKT
ncbi:MAG: hypothetical protein A2X49_10960 [Lentisphaerae bacterium GWF2_52_8]|nr:MAG: hypothetical protein A2X49_10960 [Lentisphaerae bacterium GWF2_52_8]